MTPKENLLEVLNWGKPEYVPMTGECISIIGMPIIGMLETPLRASGTDAFGVHWLVNASGQMHDASKLTFEDMGQWREKVKFPNLEELDFTPIAQAELEKIDRNEKMVAYYGTVGVYERLVSFMGFENLLCALVEEPEECRAFFDAMADWKIRLFEKLYEAYHMDIYVYFDDVATARGLFMSPETYRTVIKPAQAKIAKAVISKGVRFAMHCCGKCEDLMEDFVDIGATIWNSAQSINDIPKIQKEFKGRLVVEGGWDTEGACSRIEATEEDFRREVRRNMDEYGKNGGFILLPTILNERGNSIVVGDDRLPALMDEYMKTRNCLYV